MLTPLFTFLLMRIAIACAASWIEPQIWWFASIYLFLKSQLRPIEGDGVSRTDVCFPAFLISEFHLSGAKNKKILTSISELAGSPDSNLKESLDALPWQPIQNHLRKFLHLLLAALLLQCCTGGMTLLTFYILQDICHAYNSPTTYHAWLFAQHPRWSGHSSVQGNV